MKRIVIFMLIFIFMFLLVSCNANKEDVLMKFDEKNITIFSKIAVDVEVFCTISEGENRENMTQVIRLDKNENKNISIKDIGGEFFTDDAKIVSVEVKKITDRDKTTWLLCIIFLTIMWILIIGSITIRENVD